MRKVTVFYFFILIFSLSPLFAVEEFSFSLNRQNILPGEYENKLSDNNFNNMQIKKYSKVFSETEMNTILTKMERAHMILSIMSTTGYVANTIIGAFILSEKFQNQSYFNPLFYTHIPIGLVSGLLAATVISLGYADIGIKDKYKISYSKAFSASVFINTAFAGAEICLIAANLITSRLNPEAAKWVGLAHAITTGCLMIGITVQFGTSFVKK